MRTRAGPLRASALATFCRACSGARSGLRVRSSAACGRAAALQWRRTCPAPAWCRAQQARQPCPRPCPPERPSSSSSSGPGSREGTRAAAWPLILARGAAGVPRAGQAGAGQAWTCQGPAAGRIGAGWGAGSSGRGGAEVASGHCGGSGGLLWSSSLAPTHGLKQQLEEKEQGRVESLGRVH